MILPAPIRWWKCPSCGTTDKTERHDIHTQFHGCPALGGVTVPLIIVPAPDAKADGRQVIVKREDYAGKANPVTAVKTERGDGSNDVTVFAETAGVSGGAQ